MQIESGGPTVEEWQHQAWLSARLEAAPSPDRTPLMRREQEVLDAAVYRALPQSNAVIDAVNRPRQAIVLCLLPAGSKLPPEPALTERLGIGVVTMRTALAMLCEEGSIDTTRGRWSVRSWRWPRCHPWLPSPMPSQP